VYCRFQFLVVAVAEGDGVDVETCMRLQRVSWKVEPNLDLLADLHPCHTPT